MAKMITVGNKIVNGDQILSVQSGESNLTGAYVDIVHNKDKTTRMSFDSKQEADDFVKQLSEQLSQ